MTHESFHASVKPKVTGSWNLHQVLPRDMDFFVMLSSFAGIIGRHGQSNYASGNTYQDALAHHLCRTGARRAVSLDLGGISSFGYVAQTEGLAGTLESQGIVVSPFSVLEALLEYHCRPSRVNGDAGPNQNHPQLITGIVSPARLRAKALDPPSWMSRPLFTHFWQARSAEGEATHRGGDGTAGEPDFATLVKTLTTRREVAMAIARAIQAKLAVLLAIDCDDIDATKPMYTYGVDSLAAVEIRSWMKRSLGCEVSEFETLSELSIEALGETLLEKCVFIDESLRAAEES
jgi:acyl carrier protein